MHPLNKQSDSQATYLQRQPAVVKAGDDGWRILFAQRHTVLSEDSRRNLRPGKVAMRNTTHGRLAALCLSVFRTVNGVCAWGAGMPRSSGTHRWTNAAWSSYVLAIGKRVVLRGEQIERCWTLTMGGTCFVLKLPSWVYHSGNLFFLFSQGSERFPLPKQKKHSVPF